jgi:hypothetical protein
MMNLMDVEEIHRTRLKRYPSNLSEELTNGTLKVIKLSGL